MKVMRLIFIIALAMALTITLITIKKNPTETAENNSSNSSHPAEGNILMPSKRLSRFLAEKPKNPRASDHCKKNKKVCRQILGLKGGKTTCCNNKCVDLKYDAYNCGACKKKCLPFENCCNGKCVNVSYSRSHCGKCHAKCKRGELCFYGICNYA